MGQPSVSLSNPVARSGSASRLRTPKRSDVALPGPKAVRRRTLGPQNNPTSRQSMLFRAFAQRKCTKRRNSMDATGLLSRRKQPQVSDLVFCKLIRVWESNVRDESILFRQKVRFGCTNGRFSMDNGHAAALQSRCGRSAATPPPSSRSAATPSPSRTAAPPATMRRLTAALLRGRDAL